MQILDISIHAAQEGCDRTTSWLKEIVKEFQSTQPKRAATADVQRAQVTAKISIHAAQEGCDEN